MKYICTWVAMVVTLLPTTAQASAPSNLIRAVFSGERLWILSDGGELFSLAENDAESRREDAGGSVADICVFDGQVTVAVTKNVDPGAWYLRTFHASTWKDAGRVRRDGARLLGLVCDGIGPTLVTERNLLTFAGDHYESIPVSGDFPAFDVPIESAIISTTGTESKVYVGYNLGEWGGQLHIIDRATGHRFATPYGPITGLYPISWKRDCVAMSVGYVHLTVSGEVSIGCPDDYDVLFAKRFGERSKNMNLPDDQAYQSVPFFGVVVHEDAILALGMDGLYEINKGGTASPPVVIEFKQVGPFSVSFDHPDVVMVMTDVYGRNAMTGMAPLIAPR
ncbi:hypothetical protein ABAC460_16075 [Asticcacaulis sp. AC460]|uniref:hypothetical protein n=1 Tax=Asticcacaulis sp. AC460 TaxID=1282360 RepID=UPI0003C41105|nr:hypothetical protein [Asticcacaulis sp. AC460]ESQ88177.1 hypothetical protein ABAC460_16075 [Asticcacaulis sp. AC460]